MQILRKIIMKNEEKSVKFIHAEIYTVTMLMTLFFPQSRMNLLSVSLCF